jgi:hypothetical protein
VRRRRRGAMVYVGVWLGVNSFWLFSSPWLWCYLSSLYESFAFQYLALLLLLLHHRL